MLGRVQERWGGRAAGFSRAFALPVRRFVAAIVLAAAVSGLAAPSALAKARRAPAPPAPRYAAIVIDAASGHVYSAFEADAPRYPASLTKMMTLYLVFEDLQSRRITLNTQLTASSHAARMPATGLGLSKGQKISVLTAVEALIVRSANDVAVTVAENLAGSEAAFAERMTKKARALGMASTTFRNASGLYNREQVTTARDLARLAAALQRDFPSRYHLFNLREFSYAGQEIPTHNNLLKTYPGGDGLKTGFIQASGFNLVFSAVRDGHRMIGVVMGGQTSRWRDRRMADLLDAAFDAAASRPVRHGPALAALDTQGEAALPVGEGEGDVNPAEPAPPVRHASRTGRKSSPPVFPDWAIQVGAYSDREAADAAVRRALGAGSGPSSRSAADPRIEAVKVKNRTLFRARVVGLTYAEAQASCRTLRQGSHPCLVLKP